MGGVGRKHGGVAFDGFQDGVLMEAKGPGYANKFNADLTPKKWFKFSGAQQLIEQARRQFNLAKGTPIRWHVAEEKAAAALKKLFEGADVRGIEVVHTPAQP